MRTEFLCISVLRVASGQRVASCKSALNRPVVYSTDRSMAVVPVLVLLFVALWFILRGDLLYVLPCVIFFLCFSVFLVLRLPRLGKRELILVLFVCLFDLCLFGFVGFLFLLVSGKGCGLWLWHSLDFSLTFFLRLPRLGQRELILVLFVRLFDLCLLGFVGSLFLLGYGEGCGLWLWHSLDFSLTVFCTLSELVILSSILDLLQSPQFSFFYDVQIGKQNNLKLLFNKTILRTSVHSLCVRVSCHILQSHVFYKEIIEAV